MAYLQDIPLASIRMTAANPRTNADNDVAGLSASLTMGLAQRPTVYPLPDGSYEIITGERRIRAAQMAGWEIIPVVVEPEVGPMDLYLRRVAENLHRRDLSPLDEARALKLDWLLMNAQRLVPTARIDAVLASGAVREQMPALQQELLDHGWSPNAPVVSQDEYLRARGFGMSKAVLRKKLQILNLSPEAERGLDDAGLTEAGIRAFVRLDTDDQDHLLAAIAETPELAKEARTIVQWVRDPRKQRTMADAIAIARGQVPGEDRADERDDRPDVIAPPPTNDIAAISDERASALVMPLLDVSAQLTAAMNGITATPVEMFPDPWGEILTETLNAIRRTLQSYTTS